MTNLFNINGLVFWDDVQIKLRAHFSTLFADRLGAALTAMNPAWRFMQTEAPILTPIALINPNYTAADVWMQDKADGLVLRPETTPGSYAYAQHLLNTHSGVRLPLVVWQIGKSFRREADHVTKNMRLKEFYQQEFQCIYARDTANDYHANVLEPVATMFREALALPVRVVASERLPSYSEITMDIEVDNGDKWMEVCSISRRTDFPQSIKMTTKKGEKKVLVYVLEVAIGLDRCVYNHQQRLIKTC